MSSVAWRFAPVALVMTTLALFQPSATQTIATPTRAPAASSAASEKPASSAGKPGPTEFPDLLPDLPAVVRRSVFKEPAFASDAAPFKLPSSKHPLGTILIVAHAGLVEIDLESFAIVRKVDVGDLQLARVAATPSAAAVVRAGSSGELVLFDKELRRVASHDFGPGACNHLAAGDGFFVAAYTESDPPITKFRRFDAATGRLEVSRTHALNLCSDVNEPPRLAIAKGRVYAFSTSPTKVLHGFDSRLAKFGRVRLPIDPRYGRLSYLDNRSRGSVGVARNDVVVVEEDRMFVASPERGSARELPKVPEDGWYAFSVSGDSAGRVLLRNSFFAERLGEPLRPLARLDDRMWASPDAETYRFFDEHVAAFLWSGHAVIVTRFPGVTVRRIRLGGPH